VLCRPCRILLLATPWGTPASRRRLLYMATLTTSDRTHGHVTAPAPLPKSDIRFCAVLAAILLVVDGLWLAAVLRRAAAHATAYGSGDLAEAAALPPKAADRGCSPVISP